MNKFKGLLLLFAELAIGTIMPLQTCIARGPQLYEPLQEVAGAGVTDKARKWLNDRRAEPHAANAQAVRIAVATFDADSLSLASSTGELIEIAQTRKRVTGRNSFVWEGEVSGRKGSSAYFDVMDGKLVLGHIDLMGRVINIWPLDGGIHAMVETNLAKLPPTDHVVSRPSARSTCSRR
jgi:hypothetical protein